MYYYIFIFAMAFLSFGFSHAQTYYIESIEEIIAGNSAGIGARQMAMAGAGMMSIDGTALYYNPANLARIPRIEFLLGLSNQEFKNNSNLLNRSIHYNTTTNRIDTIFIEERFEGFAPGLGKDVDSKSNTRVNTAILSIPYPTYRGSMVIGLGVARVADFDKTLSYVHNDVSQDGNINVSGKRFESGSLIQWSGGLGIDLSPRVSIGASIAIYSGTNETNRNYRIDSLDYYFDGDELVTSKYLGYGAKVGLAMQVNYYFSFGMTISSPVFLDVDEESFLQAYQDSSGEISSYEFDDYVDYNINRPFVFSFGVQLERNNALMVLDVDYTDWSQISYSDNPSMEQENKNLKDFYNSVLRYKLGAEYVIPSLSLSLRGGYFNDPLPFRDQFIDSNRRGFSLGFGVLIDQVLTIDFAYVHGSYARNSNFFHGTADDGNLDHYLIMEEDVSYDRVYLTAATRF